MECLKQCPYGVVLVSHSSGFSGVYQCAQRLPERDGGLASPAHVKLHRCKQAAVAVWEKTGMHKEEQRGRVT